MKDCVTIVVPVYNVEKYLKKCVNSIINQTYKNLEIILVDDGSSDRSGALCDRLAKKDSRIRVIHKKNGGVSTARNAGIEVATGTYICFVDSDDWLAPDAIEKLVSAMKRDGSDLCVSSAAYVGILHVDRKRTLPDACYSREQLYALLEYRDFLRTPWAKIYKRDIIIQNCIYFPNGIAYGEDTIFVWNYLKFCNKVTMISDFTYYYSVLNSENASGKYFCDVAQWLFLSVKALEDAMHGTSLPAAKIRQMICRIAIKEVVCLEQRYANQLMDQDEALLEDRLSNTVQCFSEYLFDDALCFDDAMREESLIFREYIAQGDYPGLAAYFRNKADTCKESNRKKKLRKLLLWGRKKVVYSFW